MKTTEAFARGLAAKAAGNRLMVFDWNKAATLIVANKPHVVVAGLSGDWDWTGGDIYADGKPIPQEDTYVYLASLWATPEIQWDEYYIIECWIYEEDSPGWDAHTYWPPSALEILKTGKD